MTDAHAPPQAEKPKKVFISHSSKDKPAVEVLARALRAAGIDAWLDTWEIAPGDDIVARINEGLKASSVGLVVLSKHTKDSRWVPPETSSLFWRHIEDGKGLIPVLASEPAEVEIPELLRPLAYRRIDEVQAIIDAIHGRTSKPPLGAPAATQVHRACFAFERAGEAGLRLTFTLGGRELVKTERDALPAGVVRGRAAFVAGFRHGLRRSPEHGERAGLERDMVELGRALRELCLPGDSGRALAEVVDGCPVGSTVEVVFEADHPELLGLPFEALRLPDDGLLVARAPVVMWRRPRGLKASGRAPLAGPLKLLVAVGAPDEGQSRSSVLDSERELHNILDAVEPAQRIENFEARILEVGHPAVIGKALERDAYHVLHLSCHGMPGKLELEDEEGRAVPVTAKELLEPIIRASRPLPMVFLSACHGGVSSEETASFAEELLRAGVPMVLAMQTAVSDLYATALARAFYEHLARQEITLASRALARARKELEEARQAAVNRGESFARTQPEYATAALYVAGEEQRLVDFGPDKERLRERLVRGVAGPVPQLDLDDLIGRRKELRETLRTLRGERKDKGYAGVVLTGIGGVGKSAVAGRAMCRLAEQGYLVPAHAGRWDLQGIVSAVAMALLEATGQDEERRRKRGTLLASSQLDDGMRLRLLAATLAEERVVLVLDDFEQNLTKGGDAFLDPDVEKYLGLLLRSARAGKLLLTSRYPVPGTESYLHHLSVGPLSEAESRKLFQRLAGLRERSATDLREVLHTIGGHPRMLEFLDGLLRGGEGRLPHVTERLRKARVAAGLASDGALVGLEEGVRQTVLLGARDVFLEELLDLARREGLDETLLQASVSNLPVSPAGLAHMLAGEPADAAPVEGTLKRLEALSLVFRHADGAAWVHRWTAEGLAKRVPEAEHRERHRRAGGYRMWRVEHESHELGDAVEAMCWFSRTSTTAHPCSFAIASGPFPTFDGSGARA